MNPSDFGDVKWSGVHRGYACPYKGKEIKLTTEDAVTLRQVKRIVDRVADEDLSLRGVERLHGRSRAIEKAWEAIGAAAKTEHASGVWDYDQIEFYLTDHDCDVLGRYTELSRRAERETGS